MDHLSVADVSSKEQTDNDEEEEEYEVFYNFTTLFIRSFSLCFLFKRS